MGNSDNWTTPKQIKIEREGEPRGTRRGPLKKGERRKGRKARIDELNSALITWRRYEEWASRSPNKWWKEAVVEAKAKYEKLRDKAIADGVVTRHP